MPALLALVFGISIGWLAGGRINRIATGNLRFEASIIALFVVQGLLRGRLPGMTSAPVAATISWAIACLVLAGLLVANWRTPGAAIATAGLMLNVDVVLANAAMPIVLYGGSAAERSNALAVGQASRGFYALANVSTVTAWLSDALPLRMLGVTTMLSVGDVALAVGVVCVIVWLMCDSTEARAEIDA